MRISAKLKLDRIVFTAVMIAMMCIAPVTLMAYDNYPPYDDDDIGIIDMLRADGTFMIMFEPDPGHFPDTELTQGMRYRRAGERLYRHDFPPAPERYGYVFDGWRFWQHGGNGPRVEGYYLTVNDHITLEAIWVRYGDEVASTPTPSPSPTPSPAPGASPAPVASPAPGASPAPSPPSAPQPNPPKNPTTNPITISLMIFGAVAALGIAAFGIVSLYMRHNMAVEKFQAGATRYKRESRLVEMLEDDEFL